MNKARILYAALLFFLVFMGSCEEYLDVKPKNNLTEAQYYKTEQQAIETVTSCYDPLKHPGGFNINFFFLFTSWSDNALHEQQKINSFAITTSDSWVIEIYTYLYKGIYRCNVALEKIPGIIMDEDLKNRLLGEVHFLRALYNFYITTVYNEPPLILEVINDLDVKFNNSPREDFLAAIESDLAIAIESLPESYEDVNKGRATKVAALALMGKAYVYFQEFEKAKTYLERVKELGDQGVVGLMMPKDNTPDDYIEAYRCNFSAIDLTTPGGNTYDSENNLESIFEIQFEEGGWERWEGGWQADGSITCLYYGPDGYKNIAPHESWVNEFEETPSHPAGLEYDPRRYVTFYEPGDTIHYLPRIEKAPIAWNRNLHTNVSISEGYGWEKYFNPSWYSNNGPTNLNILRYADVLLLLAEAEYHLNGSTGLGLDCINQVRERAGLEPISTVTPEAIMHERNVEFGFEWQRFFDLVRWSLLPDPWVDIESMLEGFQKGKNEYLPIPLYEINLSGGQLKQNPGW